MDRSGRDLADWLQEAGRRDRLRTTSTPDPSSREPEFRPPPPVTTRSRFVDQRSIFALACVSGAYLQYYFIGVMTEIYSLRGVVVFVPAGPLG